MLLGGVFGLVGADGHELQMDLEGGVAQKSCELGLGDDFGGHQIQKDDLQGADVLGFRPGGAHDKDVFPLQHVRCRQVVGDANGHGVPPAYRYLPVMLSGQFLISSGVPLATMVPPWVPPPGPISTI